MRSLRDFNLPKLVGEDVSVFLALLSDIFPNVVTPSRDHSEVCEVLRCPRESGVGDCWSIDCLCLRTCPPFICSVWNLLLLCILRASQLKEALRTTLQRNELCSDDFACDKAVQLNDVLSSRHSVFVIGPTGSGKSECWKALSGAKALLGSPVIVKAINPKAVSVEELYGCMALTTREWRDVCFRLQYYCWFLHLFIFCCVCAGIVLQHHAGFWTHCKREQQMDCDGWGCGCELD